MDARSRKRHLVVPVVLAISVAGTVAAVVGATSGCGDDKPRNDAGLHDATPDTPVV